MNAWANGGWEESNPHTRCIWTSSRYCGKSCADWDGRCAWKPCRTNHTGRSDQSSACANAHLVLNALSTACHISGRPRYQQLLMAAWKRNNRKVESKMAAKYSCEKKRGKFREYRNPRILPWPIHVCLFTPKNYRDWIHSTWCSILVLVLENCQKWFCWRLRKRWWIIKALECPSWNCLTGHLTLSLF